MARSSSTLLVGGMPRVNLMPPAELERRALRTLLRRWVVGLLGAALVAFLVVVGAGTLRFFADTRLAAERARTDALITEIASLSTVGDTVGMRDDLTAYREDAMLADLGWFALLDALRATLPGGVSVIGFEVAPGNGPTEEDPATGPGATVKLTLAAGQPFDIVPAIRGIRALPAVLDADGWELRSDESKDRYLYELSVTTTQNVYSGRFVPVEGQE